MVHCFIDTFSFVKYSFTYEIKRRKQQKASDDVPGMTVNKRDYALSIVQESVSTMTNKNLQTKSADTVSYKVPAGEKTLDLLEYMARAKTPQTKSEIAAGLGKSIQEVYRIIQMLVERGYLIDEDDSGRFSLSMNLFSLAHQIPAVQCLSEVAVGPMRELVNKANQSAHLSVLWENEVIIVSQFNAPLNMCYSVALGARFPAHETSSGLVLLAGVEQKKRDHFFSTVKLHQEENLDEVRQHVADVMQTGYDIRPSLMVSGITNIAYPVRNFRGVTIAALTIPFIPMRHTTLPLDLTTTYVAQAAEAISVGMGWEAPR
jgi:DNA-binding IclR family transcriptional regulator